jgi:hypothetical protein
MGGGGVDGLQGALWTRYLQSLLAMPTKRAEVLEVFLAAIAAGGARVANGEIVVDPTAFQEADAAGLRVTYESRRGRHVLRLDRPYQPTRQEPELDNPDQQRLT